VELKAGGGLVRPPWEIKDTWMNGQQRVKWVIFSASATTKALAAGIAVSSRHGRSSRDTCAGCC
jgi:hypothetical protein